MPMYKDAKLIEHAVSRYTEYLMQHNFLIQELLSSKLKLYYLRYPLVHQ